MCVFLKKYLILQFSECVFLEKECISQICTCVFLEKYSILQMCMWVFLRFCAFRPKRNARGRRNRASTCVFLEKYAFRNPRNAGDTRNTNKSKSNHHFPQGRIGGVPMPYFSRKTPKTAIEGPKCCISRETAKTASEEDQNAVFPEKNC